MSTFKSTGIVLRSIKYGESSLIVDIYTREKGLRSYIVNGVRKPKARMSASLFQHGTMVDMVAYDTDGSQLKRIKEISLEYTYQHLPFDIQKSSITIFVLELLKNTIKEHEPNIPLYDFLQEWLIFIDTHIGSHACLHIKFMCEYAAYLGFKPNNNRSEEKPFFNLELGYFIEELSSSPYVISKERSHAVASVLSIDRDHINQLHIAKSLRNDIINDLLSFYQLHIQSFKPLKSYEILQQLF